VDCRLRVKKCKRIRALMRGAWSSSLVLAVQGIEFCLTGIKLEVSGK